MECKCRYDRATGKVLDLCGAHAEFARRIVQTEVEFVTERLNEQHATDVARKDTLIKVLIDRIATDGRMR